MFGNFPSSVTRTTTSRLRRIGNQSFYEYVIFAPFTYAKVERAYDALDRSVEPLRRDETPVGRGSRVEQAERNGVQRLNDQDQPRTGQYRVGRHADGECGTRQAETVDVAQLLDDRPGEEKHDDLRHTVRYHRQAEQ